ncbi:MAG: SH3 domain-containing protein [Dysgonamonadaceae bacterium]|jgi:hypothetical protein|nr:SH3 domain-containing protein [Dysgonamonadaceae bacterium]
MVSKSDLKKWQEVTRRIKEAQNGVNPELTTEEESAFGVLCDHWRNGSFEPDESKDLIKNIKNNLNLHVNNRDLQAALKEFSALCDKYYTKEADKFQEFKQEMRNIGRGGNISRTSSGSQTGGAFASASTPRQTPPAPPTTSSGTPRIDYSDGSYYTGDVKDNQPHGLGEMRWANGNWYRGNWQNSNRMGQGTYYYAEYQRTDVGQFLNNNRTGRGTMTWANGSKYTGEWNTNGAHGQGEMRYSNGDWYRGEWKDHKRTGHGTYYYASTKRTDTGDYLDDERHGSGVILWNDGDRYEGTWEDTDNGLNGRGIMFYADGSSKPVKWVDGKIKDNTPFVKKTLSFIWDNIIFAPWIISTIAVICIWVDKGFWWALLWGVILYFVSLIAMYCMSFIKVIIDGIWSVKWLRYTVLVLIALWLGYSLIKKWLDKMDYSYYQPKTETVAADILKGTITANTLRLRDAPSENSITLKTLKRGDVVIITGETVKNSWMPVEYEGKRGYVSAQYVQIE